MFIYLVKMYLQDALEGERFCGFVYEDPAVLAVRTRG
jgi:hypothetical protein